MQFTVGALVYQVTFGLATLGSLAGLYRARRVTDRDTRHGLIGVLLTSAVWAGSETFLFTVPDSQLAIGVYLAGLVAGFATVFAWLYFVSAYTGRTYHRNRRLRRLGLGTYLVVVGIKVTNPLHHLYFRTTFVDDPFPHLAIQQGLLHWTITGFSYCLAAIGLFLLFELYGSADYDARGLGVLVALTGIPVVFDIVGYATDAGVDVIYAPLGVAAFAVGTLYVYQDRFFAVQLASEVDDAVVFLDGDDRIRDFNRRAASYFPDLEGTIGDLVVSVPSFAAALENTEGVYEYRRDGESRYYLVSRESFELGRVAIGQLVLVTDVTAVESERREVRRQDDQLEEFAVGIRHELRNSLTVIRGHLANAADALESGDVGTARSSLSTATQSAEHMTGTVDGLATFAQHAQTIADTEPVPFPEVTREARQRADAPDVDVDVEGDGAIVADPTRLETMVVKAYEFAAATDADTVRVTLEDDGFVVETDGLPIPEAELDRAFDYGDAVPTAEAGMTLPGVRTLGRVQGFTVDIDPEYDDGVRLRVTNATVQRRPISEED